MKINSAQQEFSVQAHRQEQHGRITFNQPTPSVPALAPPAPTQQLESTASTSQNEELANEELQPFNAQLSIGAVKKILEQLKITEQNSDDTFWQFASNSVVAEQTSQFTMMPLETAANTNVTTLEWHYLHQHVSANMSGRAELADGRSIEWSFDLQMQAEQLSVRQTSAVLQDPLVLSLANTPVQLTTDSTTLDFDGRGTLRQLPGLGQQQFYLMRDQNRNQQLDSGLELFGPATGQGFSELAQLDEDRNGFIDIQDSSWHQLGLWQKDTGFQTLAHYGIAAISTESVATPFELYQQDELLGRIARSSIYLSEQGKAGLIQQIDVRV